MSEYEGIFGPKSSRKAPCPSCQKTTRVETLFQNLARWEESDGEIQGVIQHYVFQCRGCEKIFFAKATGTSEDFHSNCDYDTGEENFEYYFNRNFWPTVPSIRIPSWVENELEKFDAILAEQITQIYTAMNANLPTFAAIGIRFAFDRVSEFLEVDTKLGSGLITKR